MQSRDVVRARSLTTTGTSRECPEHPAEAQQGLTGLFTPTSSHHGYPKDKAVATGGAQYETLLHWSPFADLYLATQPSLWCYPTGFNREVMEQPPTHFHYRDVSTATARRSMQYTQLGSQGSTSPSTAILSSFQHSKMHICINSSTIFLCYRCLQHSMVSLVLAEHGRTIFLKIQVYQKASLCTHSSGATDRNTTWPQFKACKNQVAVTWWLASVCL